MLTRRSFLASAAASGLAAPALAQVRTPGTLVVGPVAPLAAAYQAQVVPIQPEVPAGQIHVMTQEFFLYWTLGAGEAVRYGIAVGEDGREFEGRAEVGRKEEWPSWTPTPDMIEREPEVYAQYEDGMPGGPENPLGARALYLFRNGADTLYRIHGTPQPQTIGRAVSSGCIRMHNDHVRDLYGRAGVGTTVFAYG